MNKLFHSIETFKKTQAEQKTNEQSNYLPNFSESLNHPFLRFFPGFLKPLLLILLGGLFLLTAYSEDDPTAPTSKTLSFNLQRVIAEGALVKDASVPVYLSGADSSLDSTTSDNQGRYSFLLQGIAPNTLSLRIQASYSKAGETITLRSYADIRAVSSSQSEQLIANVNEITEFAFSLASVQTEIDEEALDTLNRIIDRVSYLLNLADNLDFRTSPHDRNLDSYQELLKFQENTEDPSKIDIVRKDNGSSLTRFDKTLFMNPEPPEGIETTKNEFLNSGITEDIERVRTLPIPTLANGAPEEVSSLEAEPGNKQITLTWSDPNDEDFDHLEINWMPAQGDSSPPQEVSKGDETLPITGLLSETDYVFRVSAFDSDGNNSAGVIISPMPLPDRSPVIDSIDPNPVSVRAGESIEVTVSASDPDGTIPTITLGGNTPAFVALTDNRNGSASIDIRPLEAEPPARHTLIIQASSEGKTVREDLILSITALDKSPVIDSIDPNPVSVRAGESIEVPVSASDPDGTIPTITLGGNTPAFVILTNTGDGSASIGIRRPLEAEPPARHTLVIQASSEGKTVTQNLILNITAPLLTLGTEKTRSLSSGSDFYPVTLSAGTPYRFELVVPAGVNFDLYLFDADGNQVRSSTNSSTGAYEAFFYIPSESGTFTIEVRRRSGSGIYTLRANQIRTLTLGSEEETHNLSSISDYYSVTLSADTSYLFELDVSSRGLFDLYLLDADGNEVSSSTYDAGFNQAFFYTPSESGTFFVAVQRASASGTYILMANQIMLRTLTLRSDETHNLSSGSDYYSVTLSAGTPYAFDLDVPSSADFHLYLFDADGNFLRSSRSFSTGADERVTYIPSESGNFIVEVQRSSGSGTYTLMANQVMPRTLTLGTDETQSLSSGSDYYSVTLSAGTPYEFKLDVPAGVKFNLYLFDADGNEVRSSRSFSTGVDKRVTYIPSESGNFIVEVQRSSGSGTYTLMANQVMPRTLTLGTDETQSLSSGSDYYSVTLSAGTPYEFKLDVPSGVNFDLLLLDADGNQVRSSTSRGAGVDEAFFYIPPESGTFIVEVRSFSSSSTYTLRANQVTSRTLTLGTDETQSLSSGSDYYSVTLSAGTPYEFKLDVPSGVNFDLLLLDADGNQVRSSTSRGAGVDEAFFYIPPESGTFIVEVRSFSSSSTYTLMANQVTPRTLTLETDETQSLSSGSDYYSVTLSAGTPYEFKLDVPSGVNFDLLLLDADGNQVRSSTSFSTGVDEAFFYTPSESGTFIVEVRRRYGSGTYTLKGATP